MGNEEDFWLAPESRIGLLALKVVDLQKMTTFYREVIGLTVLKETADLVYLGVQPNQTVLLTLRKAAKTISGPTEANLTDFSLMLPHEQDFQSWLVALQAREIGDPEVLVSDETAFVAVTDPENNIVHVGINFYNQRWQDNLNEDWLHTQTTPESITDYLGGHEHAEQQLPAGTLIGWPTFAVADVTAPSEFYAYNLGYKAETSDDEVRTVVSTPQNGHCQFQLVKSDQVTEGRQSQTTGIDYLNIKLPSAQAINELHQSLSSKKIEHKFDESDSLLFIPDGNNINFSFSVA